MNVFVVRDEYESTGKVTWYIGSALKISQQNKMLAVIVTNEKWQ